MKFNIFIVQCVKTQHIISGQHWKDNNRLGKTHKSGEKLDGGSEMCSSLSPCGMHSIMNTIKPHIAQYCIFSYLTRLLSASI